MRPIETSFPERNLRRFRVGAAGLVGSLLLAASTPAHAFPEAPGFVLDYLSKTAGPGKPASDCTPTCSLCHTSPSPSRENAGTLLANNLLAFRSKMKPGGGMYPPSIERNNFETFLEALELDPCQSPEDIACMNPAMCLVCDADKDGDPDIAELRADSDPNNEGAKLACPQYGCGAHVAPERPTRPLDGTAALAALSAAIVFVRRLRRR